MIIIFFLPSDNIDKATYKLYELRNKFLSSLLISLNFFTNN